jgi:HPt (histidine-containing phosphotransfer) domain-containing protein
MAEELLDLKFLYDLSGNDTSYINDVIRLFIDNVPNGIEKLEHLIRETNDYEAIQRQAHLLKSSAGIIKIREMYDDLATLEKLAKQEAGKADIIAKLDNLLVNFREAMPLILAEEEKTRQQQ